MHFYFTIYTKQQLDIANITHNIYQIVLHLPNCASPKIRGCVPSSRFCWWQKREQAADAFSSIKSKPYFFKNNTLLSTKQHVVFNKTTRHFLETTRHFQQRSFAAQCAPQDGAPQILSYKTQKNKLFPLHLRAYARIYAHITRVLSFLLSHLSHLFAQNS